MKVVGDPGVERSVILVGHDVNPVIIGFHGIYDNTDWVCNENMKNEIALYLAMTGEKI